MIILYILLFIIFVFCYVCYRRLNPSSKMIEPEATTINLPSKIFFTPTADNSSGIGRLALNVVTIGGHGTLKTAKYNYEQTYKNYADNFNELIDINDQNNVVLNSIGLTTFNILKEIEKSMNILDKSLNENFSNSVLNNFSNTKNSVQRLNKSFLKTSSTGESLMQGCAVGGLAAVGTWSVLSIVGVSSTGTAIVTLNGIAASNAIYAILGGGTLAAGGGGVAAGAMTLGGILVAPIVAVSAYTTYSSANKLKNETKDLTLKIKDINQEIKSMKKLNNELLKHRNELNVKLDTIQNINKLICDVIYPNGIFGAAKRTINDLLNQNFYTQEEVKKIEELIILVENFQNSFLSQKNVKSIS